jgi:hypothetical protein
LAINFVVSGIPSTQVRDSIQGANTTRTILELKERFNAAEKDRAIALLNERAARRQLYTWLSLIALVLVVVIGLYLHQVRQRRVRAERDAAIIREREAGLKAVFQATEEERRRLARELHDGVGQQLGGLKHRLEHLRAQTDTDAVNETITVDLSRLPANVAQIIFFLNNVGQEDFSMIPYAKIRMFDGTPTNVREIVAAYNVAAEPQFKGRRAMILGRLYRHGEYWKFAAIGEPTSDEFVGQTVLRVANDYRTA